MKLALLSLFAGLLLLGCTVPPSSPSPSPSVVATVVASVTPAATFVPTASTTPAPLASVSPVDLCKVKEFKSQCKAAIAKYAFDESSKSCKEIKWGGCGSPQPFNTLQECQAACGVAVTPTLSPTVSPVVSVAASPTVSVLPSVTPVPSPAASDLKTVAESVYGIALKHFGKSPSLRVYESAYGVYSVSALEPKYRLDVFVRRAKFKWGQYDYLTAFTSPSNKTVNGTFTYDPNAAYYGYNFRFLCFNDVVEIEAQTREYLVEPSATPSLGKTFASLVVDVCA